MNVIIEKTPSKIQPVWLRVSSDCFELAGKSIYAEIELRGTRFDKLIEGCRDGAIEGGGEGGKAARGFKATLLSYVQTITIHRHQWECRTLSRSTMIQAARLMTNLKQTILCPDSGIKSIREFCSHGVCPIIAGLASDSVTIHNIRAVGPSGSLPLHQFMPIFDNVKHATLFLPTTASYVGRGVFLKRKHGLPQDLAYPTRKLDSVRLLIGLNDSEIESMEHTLERAVGLCKTSHLQDFLASFIALNPTRVEIYLFSNVEFPKPQNLDEFKQELAIKVDKQYESLLAKIKDPDEKQSNWVANYQVHDLEHYFAQPGLCNELESWVLSDWKADLKWLRDYEKEETMKARRKQLVKDGTVGTFTHL